MSFEPHAITLVISARQAFESASSIPEIKRARGLAKAARDYAESANATRKTLLSAACLFIRAEHKLGTALASTTLAKAAQGNQYTGKKTLDRFHDENGPHFLRDLGLNGPASHRAQQLAVLTANELELWLARQCAAGIEPTLIAVRRYAKEKAATCTNGMRSSRQRAGRRSQEKI